MTKLEIRRGRAEHRAARRRRDRRQRAAPRRQDPGRSTRSRAGSRRRSADAGARRRCCSSRCCSILLDNAAKYAPAGTTISGSAAGGIGCRSGCRSSDEGNGIPPARSRTHLRQVLPRAEGRSRPCRHRPRSCDLPRLRRSDARHDRPPPTAPTGAARVFTIRLPIPAATAALDTAA